MKSNVTQAAIQVIFVSATFGILSSCRSRFSQESAQVNEEIQFEFKKVKEKLESKCDGKSVPVGKALECIPANEEALITQAVETTLAGVREKQKSTSEKSGKNELFKRDVHPKHHGCLKGELTVLEGVPKQMQTGVFEKSGAKFKVWSRFSNAHLVPISSDESPDARGMALKVINVPGESFFPANSSVSSGENLPATKSKMQNLDFAFVDIPFFIARNVYEYNLQLKFQKDAKPLDAIQAATKTKMASLIAKGLSFSKMKNPISNTYFSISSFRLGDAVVKYRAIPCSGKENLDTEGKTGSVKFADALEATLKREDGCYRIEAQELLVASHSMVEDTTLTWDEHIENARGFRYGAETPVERNAAVSNFISSWTPLAEVNFPKQNFRSEAQNSFCENLSFNPWRTNIEMRPLGGLNRARRSVYESVASLRRKGNGVSQSEPTGNETFE